MFKMKKFIAIVAAALCFAAVASAQPKAIGLRIGYGAEISYQHTLGGSNFLEADLGWALGQNGGLDLGLSYDFTVAPLGPLNFYVGPSAQAWLGFGENTVFGLGVGAQIGLEYTFSFPLQLSLDWRPTFFFIPGTAFGWNSIALGIRYTF